MNKLIYGIKRIPSFLILILLLFSGNLQAQNGGSDTKNINVDIGVHGNNGGAFYTAWWFWVIVVLLFIIIIVAITSKRRKS